MKLKYNHNGETNAIPLSTNKPSGKRLAMRHDNQTYYAPLVPTTDSASDMHLVFGGDTLALSTGAPPPDFVFYPASVTSDLATAVTLNCQYADFGVIKDTSQPEGYNATLTKGTEYYSRLASITANQHNSTIIGNDTNNQITITGGASNVLTGGAGVDRYYFKSGGGIITDFGIGATRLGDRSNLPRYASVTSSSYVTYDRTDPDSYQRGSDYLQLNGTVTAIDFTNYGNNSRNEPHANVTVYYAHDNGNTYSVALPNILRNPSTYNTTDITQAKYAYDSVVARSIKIYDMSTGEMASLTPDQKHAFCSAQGG